MATANIEDLKAQLTSKKARVDAVTSKKDGLIRQAAQNEEQQQQAIRELVELGYPQAATLDAAGLEALQDSLVEQLTSGLQTLETQLVEAERLLGVSKTVDPLDL